MDRGLQILVGTTSGDVLIFRSNFDGMNLQFAECAIKKVATKSREDPRLKAINGKFGGGKKQNKNVQSISI